MEAESGSHRELSRGSRRQSFEGNSATGTGGGVYFRTGYDGPSSSSLTLDNVTLTQNSALNGGGIFAAAAISNLTGPGLVFNGGAVSGNTAATDGGGVYSRLQNLTVNHTTISGNQALRNGGAIALPQSAGIFVQVSIVGAVMEGNVASAGTIEGPGTGDGGAIWIVSNMSTLSVINSILNNNSARNGGAIFRRSTTPSGPVSISASSITGNTARLSGGGLYNYRGPLVISNSTIAGNGASPLPGSDGQGGGIFNRQGDVSMNASSLTGNNAPSRGGGLYHDQGDLTVTASTIAGNSAGFDGGGVLALTSSQVDRIAIQSSTVSGNSAPRTGGFYLRGDTTIRQSTIVGNAGGRGGAGGIVVGDGSSRFELDHSIVAKNTQTGFAPPDIRFFGSMFNVTLRWSLIGDSDGSMLVETPLGSPDVNGNLIGKSVSAGGSGVIDPLVGPLANNGGPTLTHALLPGSPALDSGALVTGQP